MNRPDLFLRGQSSFTDVLAEMSVSLKSIATVLSETKKRPRDDRPRDVRDDESKIDLAPLLSIAASISAFEKICAEEEHIDPEDALELLRDVKNKCLKIVTQEEFFRE